MSNQLNDIRDILYIQIISQKITEIRPFDFEAAEKTLNDSFPIQKLLTELNWVFLNAVKRKFTVEKKDFWLNVGRMKTGARKGDLYVYLFIDEFYFIITQSRPAGSYKIAGKYQTPKN